MCQLSAMRYIDIRISIVIYIIYGYMDALWVPHQVSSVCVSE